jgi:hypothetical protein
MKKYALVLVLLLLVGLAYAEDRLSFSGYVKNETSLREEGLNSDLTKFKNIVELSGQYKIKEDEVVFFGKAQYWYDAAYDLSDKMDLGQHYNGHIQRTDWLRDCYLDYTRGPWFLRLGKQQIAWGQADGITVLDRVNPVDLTEFWLRDFVDLRIPLWMVNINFSPKLNSNLQLLFIPDFDASEAAYLGGPFTFRSFKEWDNFQQAQMKAGSIFDLTLRTPPKQLHNATWGLQWSDRIGDLNYTLNYLYGPSYNARNDIYYSPPTYTIPRAFKVWRIYGSSFNKTFTNPGPLQGITLKGDLACYNDEPTYYGDPVANSTKGIARWNNVFWIMGMDKYILTKWLCSFQFGQYILEHAREKSKNRILQQQYPMNAYTYGPADQVENIFSLKISSHFMNDRLMPEVLWSCTDDNQGRLSPKINYELRDNLWLTVGVHYFYGNEWDTNGQFRDQSQLYTNLKYSF